MLPVLVAAVTPVAQAAAKATAAATSVPLPQALQNLPLKYQAQTPLQAHAAWLTHTLAVLFIIASLLLIAMLAIQTTKQEGLSGTIGGRVDSAYRGRLGMEGQISRITGMIAVAFVVIATIVSLSGI